jgi:hypothetical protein
MESTNRRITVQAGPGVNVRLCLKNSQKKKEKRAGGEWLKWQVCLPSKFKALSSSPIIARRKERKERRKGRKTGRQKERQKEKHKERERKKKERKRKQERKESRQRERI